ncbi:MAG: DUF4340 domain-containing protein, partial [Brevinema sp.]
IETILYKETNSFRYNIKKNQGTWYLDSPIQIVAQQDKSIVLVNEFLNLKPSSLLSNISVEEFDSFGLNNPSLKISGIFKDNITNFFIVGNKTSVGEQYYVATSQKSKLVYLIDNKALSYFINGISHLIDPYFISRPIDQVVSISLKTFQNEIFIFTNDNEWSQITPSTNNELDWGIRRFLLYTKELKFNPNNITFNISNETLSTLKIDTNTSPMLKLLYNDGTKVLFYIGTELKNNYYPVYSVSQHLISFSDQNIINQIFNITEKDLEIKKN